MDFNKKRILERDGYFYSSLRACLQDYCTKHGLGRYDVHFASILGYTSKTASIQFSSSIQDANYRNFSVDELRIIIDELKEDSLPFISRLLSNSGLTVNFCPVTASHSDLSDYSLDGVVALGSFFDKVKQSFADGRLTVDEKKELLASFDDLQSFFMDLHASLNGVEVNG